MTKRGFLLGKFMPPHAGHIALIHAARALVDELTVLVCWLPGDPIAGETRLAWMRELAPDCRVIGVEGLRVADSSIFPHVTYGNLNGPSIMTGEKASDHILGRRLPRSNLGPVIAANWRTSQR